MKNKGIRTNGFLKMLGVIVLVVLCAICSVFGYFFIYFNYAGPTESYYDTNECYLGLVNRARVRVENIVYDIHEDVKQAGNETYQIEQYDGTEWTLVEGEKVESLSQYDTVSYALFYAMPGLEEWDGELYNYYYSDRAQVEESGLYEGEIAYLVTTCLNVPEGKNDLYYEEYKFYDVVSANVSNAVPVLVVCLWIALVIIILEMIGAGYRSEYDGIYLSWFDRIPLDLLTVVVGMAVTGLGLLTGLHFSMYNGLNLQDMANLITPISLIELICLIVYFYFISIAVRIKSHTFLSNNIISKLFKGVFGTFHGMMNVLHRIYRTFWEAPAKWKAVVLAAYGCGIIVQIFTIGNTGFFGLVLLVITVMGGYVVLQCGRDFNILSEAVTKLSSGQLEYRIDESQLLDMKGPFYQMGKSFDEIGTAMETAVNEKMKSERMRTELITNVSHDLKTPLTSIINYVDLLKKEHTEEQEKEYLDVLDRQSQRLKRLTEDVVEASKASTGNIQVDLQPIGVREILDQAIAEYEEKLDAAELRIIRSMSDEQLHALADGRLLWRVVRNLLSNICKYALPKTRVYIDVMHKAGNVEIIFKNTSADELNISVEELKERFVRGDSSRHVEGSGLGLSIVESLMKVMHGTCELMVDGDLFKVRLTLPAVQ